MNILRNVRWGYTGDGMACGPVGGFDVVEMIVEKDNGKLAFIRLDCMDQYAGVTVRNHSTFDDFVFINDDDSLTNDYDFDMYEFGDEDGENDPNFSVVNLGLTVLRHLREIDTYDEDGRAAEYDGARAFVREWLDEDLDECDIPHFRLGDDEEEEEEEE